MTGRKNGAPTPTTDRTVAGENWDGRDISGETHTRIAFMDLDLTEVVNTGAVFTDCTFQRARFNVSKHQDAAFINCTFTACSFFDTTFTECKLVGSKFDRCTYDLMRVVGGNWSFVGLSGADLRKATFRETRLREADLAGVKCQGASLRDVDLSGASLDGANFTDSDLRGSDLSAVEPEHVVLTGAIITLNQAVVLITSMGLDVRVE